MSSAKVKDGVIIASPNIDLTEGATVTVVLDADMANGDADEVTRSMPPLSRRSLRRSSEAPWNQLASRSRRSRLASAVYSTPKNKSATLMVMVQAAHAAGLEMGLSFKKTRNTRRRNFARAAGNAGVNADARARARPARQRPARRSSRSTGPTVPR